MVLFLGETMRTMAMSAKCRNISNAVLLGAALALGAGAATYTSPTWAQTQQVSPLGYQIAQFAKSDKAISAFYAQNGYELVFMDKSSKARKRRAELLKALKNAGDHGLAPYDYEVLKIKPRSVKSDQELAQLEVAIAKLYLEYARDIQTGQLIPSRIDREIVRKVPYRDGTSLIANFVQSNAKAYLKKLAPQTPEYERLLEEKQALEKVLGKGGWGQVVPSARYEMGAAGAGVEILRQRLKAMGYLERASGNAFDDKLFNAVRLFQQAHGLSTDGVVGPGTLNEINKSPEERLGSIYVAMERERWTNMDRGDRHIWVNLTDYSAQIVDGDKVSFQTRSVIGANDRDRRSPEFSDVMEHMVINPTWNVPRSIATKEYLPLMQKDPNAASHLRVVDTRGNSVDRSSVDFAQYTESTFPFLLKQPPSRRNALGLVKFMFPNKYNIYLHDTPAKSLFGREARAFSHGCIRLQQPFEFAYELLSKQTSNPQGVFHAHLDTGREKVVPLKKRVPVHIVYRTAFTSPEGGMQYRRDVYRRDAKIWSALQKQGVRLRAVR